MNARTIGIIAVIAASLFTINAVVATDAFSQATVKLTYANFPPAGTFPCVQMERWKKEVEKRTNGKVQVNTFPGGTLASAKNMFDAVMTGLADIGCFGISYHPGRFIVSEAVDLPLGFTSATAASVAQYDFIQKYPKDFDSVKIITLFTTAPTQLSTINPVRSLKDLKGLELRTSGTGAEAVSRIGGTPVAMPQTDTPEALQKGVIKGNVSSVDVLKDFNFAAYCRYTTMMNLNVNSLAVVMNKEKWNSLPPDVRQVIDDLRREQAEWTGKYLDEHCKEAFTWSKEKYNHQIIEFSTEDKAEIEKLVKPIVADYIKRVTAQGVAGEQMIQDLVKLRDKYEKEFK